MPQAIGCAGFRGSYDSRLVACQWVCFVSNSYKGGVVSSRRVVSNSWLGL